MKILLIHPRLSVKGGGERVAIHSILAATKAGHEVSLLSEEFDETSFEDFFGCSGLFNTVERCYYPAFRPVLPRGVLLYQRLAYHWVKIRRAVAIHEFDIALSTQDIGYVPSTVAPVTQYCYFPEYFSHLQTSSPSAMWRLYYRPASSFYRNRVHRVDTLLSVSDYTGGFVKKKWNRQSVTVYPPCPIEDYSQLSKLQTRENLVVTVGRLVPEKRFDVFAELSRMVPKTRFVAIGSLSKDQLGYYEHLRQTAPGNLSFVLSPLRKAREILGRAMCYVHCAIGEHFGITIVEAMAAGCVPIVHDSGGPREIVSSDVGFRWREPATAARQIMMLARDEKLRQRLSIGASARSEKYGADVFEMEMNKVFHNYESLGC